MNKKKITPTNCDTCAYYIFDNDYGCSVCMIDLDEDEYNKYLQSSFDACPYYQYYDEYKIVRKQK